MKKTWSKKSRDTVHCGFAILRNYLPVTQYTSFSCMTLYLRPELNAFSTKANKNNPSIYTHHTLNRLSREMDEAFAYIDEKIWAWARVEVVLAFFGNLHRNKPISPRRCVHNGRYNVGGLYLSIITTHRWSCIGHCQLDLKIYHDPTIHAGQGLPVHYVNKSPTHLIRQYL